MSARKRKDSYNEPTIPWYCSSDTPRNKRKYPREIPTFEEERRAAHMRANQYVYKTVREEWKEGDRFVICDLPEDDGSEEWKKMRLKQGCQAEEFAGWTGTFEKVETRGSSVWIKIKFDGSFDPQGKKHYIGIFQFYHFAEKLD